MSAQTTRRIFGQGDEPSAPPELPGSFRVSAMLMQDAVPADVVQLHSGLNQVALFANPFLDYREEALVIDNNGHLTYLRRTAESDTGWAQDPVPGSSGEPAAAAEVVVIVHPADLSVWAIVADSSNQLKPFQLVPDGGPGAASWKWRDPSVIVWTASRPPKNKPVQLSVYYDGTHPWIFGVDSVLRSPFRLSAAVQGNRVPLPRFVGTSSLMQIKQAITQFAGGYSLETDGGDARAYSVYFRSGETLYLCYPDDGTNRVIQIDDKVSDVIGTYCTPPGEIPVRIGCVYMRTDGMLRTYHPLDGHSEMPGTGFSRGGRIWRDANGFHHIYGLQQVSGVTSTFRLKVLHQSSWSPHGHPDWQSATAAITVELSAQPNPATAGDPVTLTAKVTGYPGTPTGTVTFMDGDRNLTDPISLDATGSASSSIPAWRQDREWNDHRVAPGGLSAFYADTNQLICPPGRIVTGFALRQKVDPDNRIAPALQHSNADGSDPQWLVHEGNDGNYFGDLGPFYCDTNLLTCPAGRIVTGFALRRKGHPSNRMAPALQHSNPDRSDPQWLFHEGNDSNFFPVRGGLWEFAVDTNTLTCAAGTQVRGIALQRKGGSRPGGEKERMEPGMLSSPLAPGVHSLTAVYSGDDTHVPAKSERVDLSVVAAAAADQSSQVRVVPKVPVTVGLYSKVAEFAIDAHPDYQPSQFIRFDGASPAEEFCIASQDNLGGEWAVDKVRLTNGRTPHIVSRYVADATLLSAQGSPMSGLPVTVSADTLVHVEVSGSSYLVGPGKRAIVTTNELGKLTVAVNADGLVPPSVQLNAEGLPMGTSIDFAAAVHDYLAGNGTLPSQSGPLTGTSLEGARATGNDGTSATLVTTWPTDMDAQQMVDHCSTVYGMAAGNPPPKFMIEGYAEPQDVAGYVIQTWNPDKPGFQVLHTDEQFQAHRDYLAAHPMYGGVWEDFLSWASDVWEGIKSGATAVGQILVDLRNSVVEICIRIGEAIVSLGKMIIDTIEQAARAVESFFQMVAEAVMRVIDWLKALFNFSDIWDTKTAMHGMINQMPTTIKQVADHYEHVVHGWFTQQQEYVKTLLDTYRAQIGDSRAGDFSNRAPAVPAGQGGVAAPDDLRSNPQANWMQSQLTTPAAMAHLEAAFRDIEPPDPIIVAAEQLFSVMTSPPGPGLRSPLDDLVAAATSAGEAIVALFDLSDPASASKLALAKMIDCIENVAHAFLNFCDLVVAAVFKLIRAFADGMIVLLNTEFPLGPLKPVWEWLMGLAGHPDEKPTLGNIGCLLAAFPATILYKLVMGADNPPFPGGVFPVLPPLFPPRTPQDGPWHPSGHYSSPADGYRSYGANTVADILIMLPYNVFDVATTMSSESQVFNVFNWIFTFLAFVPFSTPPTFDQYPDTLWWGYWEVWVLNSALGVFTTWKFKKVPKRWLDNKGAFLVSLLGISAVAFAIAPAVTENNLPSMAVGILGSISTVTPIVMPFAKGAWAVLIPIKAAIDAVVNAACGITGIALTVTAVNNGVCWDYPEGQARRSTTTTDFEDFDPRGASVGQPYYFAAHCSSGNQFPFTYACTGDLPPGMNFNPGAPDDNGPSSFTISGTPTQACAGKTYRVNITVTDSNNFPPFQTWHHLEFDFR